MSSRFNDAAAAALTACDVVGKSGWASGSKERAQYNQLYENAGHTNENRRSTATFQRLRPGMGHHNLQQSKDGSRKKNWGHLHPEESFEREWRIIGNVDTSYIGFRCYSDPLKRCHFGKLGIQRRCLEKCYEFVRRNVWHAIGFDTWWRYDIRLWIF